MKSRFWRMLRTAGPHPDSAVLDLTPWGRANQATIPKRIEVNASPANNQRKDRFARKPAVAGPKAQPAFRDIRYAENAMIRCPLGTRSARSALLARRYSSPGVP